MFAQGRGRHGRQPNIQHIITLLHTKALMFTILCLIGLAIPKEKIYIIDHLLGKSNPNTRTRILCYFLPEKHGIVLFYCIYGFSILNLLYELWTMVFFKFIMLILKEKFVCKIPFVRARNWPMQPIGQARATIGYLVFIYKIPYPRARFA